MNFTLEMSGAVATGNISPEAIAQFGNAFHGMLGLVGGGLIMLFILIGIREAVRKAIALWKSGNNKQLGWFICLFIFNTAGILPILYLLFRQKKGKK